MAQEVPLTMTRACLLLVFTFFGSLTPGQKLKPDSLKQLVANSSEDTVLINTLNLLAYELRNRQPDSAVIFAERALQLSEKLDYPPGFAPGWMAKGVALLNLGEAARALECLNTALHRKPGGRILTKALNNRGLVFNAMGNYTAALKDYYHALELAEAKKDSVVIASSYNNLGNVYRKQKNFSEALKCFSKALTLKKAMNDLKGMAISYNNIGLLHDEMGNYAAAIENHEAARVIRMQRNDKIGMAASYNNMGNIYFHQKNYDAALKNHLEAYRIRKELNDKSGLATSAINLGSIYTKLNKLAEARTRLEEGRRLAEQIQSVYFLQDIYRNLAELDSISGDARSGLAHYKLFIIYRDSLFNEENTKKTVQAQMQYEFDKKEAAGRLEQEKKDAVAAAEKHRQRVVLYAISAFGLLVLGFAIFAYRSFLQKRRANVEISRQKALIEEKQTEILDSIRYARRIQASLLPTEQYISRHLQRLRAQAGLPGSR